MPITVVETRRQWGYHTPIMSQTLNESIEELHGIFESTDLEVEWKKIQQKMEDARCNPGAIRPLADCMFSILLAARSRGYTPDMVMAELE